MPIPTQYRAAIQQAEFRYNVPGALIAAVCEDTGWNPNYLLLNADLSIRRIGLAGIWSRLPEFPFDAYHGLCYWGWYPQSIYCSTITCAEVPRPSGTDVIQNGTPPFDWAKHIDAAARILRQCWDWSVSACGYPSTLIWYYWNMGPCAFTGACTLPANLPDQYRQYITRMNTIIEQYCIESPGVVCPLPPPGLQAPSVSLSANALTVAPNVPLTFQANASGGLAPYSYLFSFGDQTTARVQNPTVQHVYAAEGTYSASVMVTDTLGVSATSMALVITVKIGAPPPPGGVSPALWALLGLVGLAGIIGLSKGKSKRQQAQEKRMQAQRLRAEASRLRAQGKNDQATRLEQQAQQLEREATQLDQEASLEEQRKAQEAMRPR